LRLVNQTADIHALGGFNPTLVRLRRIPYDAFFLPLLRFNPTLVRLRPPSLI